MVRLLYLTEATMDERIPERTLTIKCANETQKNTFNLHIFTAEQFKRRYRVGKRNVHPMPPSQDATWWQNHYRLRVNGKWLTDRASKYRFYSAGELLEVIASLSCLS